MEVAHTEHSHIIGKGGNNMKRLMQDTGCHIHFPDSNRSSGAEKSNQVEPPSWLYTVTVLKFCIKLTSLAVEE